MRAAAHCALRAAQVLRAARCASRWHAACPVFDTASGVNIVATPKEQHDARPRAHATGSAAAPVGDRLYRAHADGTSREAPAAGIAAPEPGAPEHGGPPADTD